MSPSRLPVPAYPSLSPASCHDPLVHHKGCNVQPWRCARPSRVADDQTLTADQPVVALVEILSARPNEALTLAEVTDGSA